MLALVEKRGYFTAVILINFNGRAEMLDGFLVKRFYDWILNDGQCHFSFTISYM